MARKDMYRMQEILSTYLQVNKEGDYRIFVETKQIKTAGGRSL